MMAGAGTYRARYVTEQWFRRQGLPFFVAPRHRGRRLLARSAPVLVFLAVFGVCATVLMQVLSPVLQLFLEEGAGAGSALAEGGDLIPLGFSLVVLGVLFLLLLILPATLAALVRRFVQTRPAWARLASLGSLIPLIAVIPLLSLGLDGASWLLDTLTAIIVVLIVLGMTWLGVGSVAGWSLRAAVKQLSAIWLLASVALPLLILVVIFAFYSMETWQMASRLPRGQMFWLLLFLAAVGLMFVIHGARKEVMTVPQALTEEARRKLLEDTPLAGMQGEGSDRVSVTDDVTADAGALEGPEVSPARGSVAPAGRGGNELNGQNELDGWSGLNRLERANVVLVLVLAQSIQVLIFGFLAFVFLMVLCTLSIPPDLAQLWSGRPDVPSEFFGLSFGAFPQNQVRVSAFLAGIAALNFAVSVNSSRSYRDAFYDPLITQTRKVMAVHVAYQARFIAPETPSAAHPAEGKPAVKSVAGQVPEEVEEPETVGHVEEGEQLPAGQETAGGKRGKRERRRS